MTGEAPKPSQIVRLVGSRAPIDPISARENSPAFSNGGSVTISGNSRPSTCCFLPSAYRVPPTTHSLLPIPRFLPQGRFTPVSVWIICSDFSAEVRSKRPLFRVHGHRATRLRGFWTLEKVDSPKWKRSRNPARTNFHPPLRPRSSRHLPPFGFALPAFEFFQPRTPETHALKFLPEKRDRENQWLVVSGQWLGLGGAGVRG
jgi:hypothetical protein